ncbi:MAG: hypothetical protein DMG13_17285 [Acidobacteria bacterium]|nr:MAG: hypothetical protein DMG13_17285 [Acidobacteriota bacterium]
MLDEIQSSDAALAGGKAFNCARLRRAGLPVPDGLVLTTEAMGNQAEIPGLQRWLANLPNGNLLAVRSSAVGEDSAGHSFAGIHETRLNVRPEDVPEAVRSCWASVTSPAALAYRRAQHLPLDKPKTAVLIQRMIEAVVSGVAFTVNPVTGRTDELLINSSFGLGEALVSGRLEPDQFSVRKTDGQILSSNLAGAASSLTISQLRELTELLLRIERYFGSAQDVEWCHDGSQFWIVQSRPITSGDTRHRKDLEWTRANSREVLPDLASPMTVYSIADAIEQAERKYLGKLLAPETDLGRMAQVFYGRMYFNVDQIRYTCKVTHTPTGLILRSLGHEGDIAPEDERTQHASWIEILQALPDMVRLAAGQLTVAKRVRQQLVRMERYIQDLRSRDPRNLSDQEIWTENRKWRPRVADELQLVFVLTGVSTYERALQAICERVSMPYERLLHTYLAAGEKSVSSQQAFDLLRLVQIARREGGRLDGPEFQAGFKTFLERYGHRGRYESDVAVPRYVEDPSPLMFAIQSHLQTVNAPDPDEIMQRQNIGAAGARQEFESRLSFWQRLTVAPGARWLLRRIKRFYLWRELVRSELVRAGLPLRMFHLELARRFVERGWIDSRDDYFYLLLSDVDWAVDNPDAGPSLKAIVARRKFEWARLANLNMPLLMKESQLPAIIRKSTAFSPAETASELHGLCVSAGYAEGEVVIMRDPAEFSRMKPGAILVAPATDPSWTPLFTLAAGVIVEVGGILSHASTVAREYGLPALANVKDATRILKDNDRVRLDATNGVVQVQRAEGTIR